MTWEILCQYTKGFESQHLDLNPSPMLIGPSNKSWGGDVMTSGQQLNGRVIS